MFLIKEPRGILCDHHPENLHTFLHTDNNIYNPLDIDSKQINITTQCYLLQNFLLNNTVQRTKCSTGCFFFFVFVIFYHIVKMLQGSCFPLISWLPQGNQAVLLGFKSLRSFQLVCRNIVTLSGPSHSSLKPGYPQSAP